MEVSYNIIESSFTFKEWLNFLNIFDERNGAFYITTSVKIFQNS